MLFLTIAVVAPLGAMAAGTPAPKEIAASIKSAEPYGEGKLKRLIIVAYKAALWTDASTWSYDAPFALSITYNMGFTRDELVGRTLEEMDAQEALPKDAAARYRSELDAAFTDVADGDRFTALYSPKGAVRFYHNGRLTRTITDGVFAKRFFDIWLSEKTSEPSLRRGLLARDA